MSEMISSSINNIELVTAAKIMGVGRNKLFATLKEYKILEKNGEPTQQMINEGYFTTTISSYKLPGYNMDKFHKKAIVTSKGLPFIKAIAISAGLITEETKAS